MKNLELKESFEILKNRFVVLEQLESELAFFDSHRSDKVFLEKYREQLRLVRIATNIHDLTVIKMINQCEPGD
jgi:hypothetical protein